MQIGACMSCRRICILYVCSFASRLASREIRGREADWTHMHQQVSRGAAYIPCSNLAAAINRLLSCATENALAAADPLITRIFMQFHCLTLDTDTCHCLRPRSLYHTLFLKLCCVLQRRVTNALHTEIQSSANNACVTPCCGYLFVPCTHCQCCRFLIALMFGANVNQICCVTSSAHI